MIRTEETRRPSSSKAAVSSSTNNEVQVDAQKQDGNTNNNEDRAATVHQQPTTGHAAYHDNIINTNTKKAVQQSKEAVGPGDHVYAVREIILCNSKPNNAVATAHGKLQGEEEEHNNCYHYPRIITSQIVHVDEVTFQKLDMRKSATSSGGEDSTTATVLCSHPTAESSDHLLNDNSVDSSSSSSSSSNAIIATDGSYFYNCTAKSIWDLWDQIMKEMIGYDDEEESAGDAIKSCPIAFVGQNVINQKKKKGNENKKKNVWNMRNFPTRIYKCLGQKKKMTMSNMLKPSKKRTRKSKQKAPLMVINNGLIDWNSSSGIANCSNIALLMSSISCWSTLVTYTTTTASDTNTRNSSSSGSVGQLKKMKKKGRDTAITKVDTSKISFGATIFSNEAVIYNSIQPSEYIYNVNLIMSRAK